MARSVVKWPTIIEKKKYGLSRRMKAFAQVIPIPRRDESNGGATLRPKGALAPPKYLKKLVYI